MFNIGKSSFISQTNTMKKGFYYIIALLIVSLFWSCSTKKNTKASRFYHAFNSRYNIYFNGKTSFDEALLSMQNGYKESYSDMILMYPISAQPKDKPETGGPFDRAIEKSNKAIKLHSIKAKPPKKPGWRNDPKQRAWQEQEEYNPFLKKCWLMMGQAQFYNADFLQASATFSYIARHYAHDEEVVAEARLWQARCYSEMEWFYEAEDILGKLNTNGIPRKNLNQTGSVDHATGSYLINRTGLLISNRNAGYFAVAVLQKPYDFRVVQDTSTSVDRAADHINRKTGIIELAVMIKHPGGHPFRSEHRNGTERPFRTDTNRTSQT